MSRLKRVKRAWLGMFALSVVGGGSLQAEPGIFSRYFRDQRPASVVVERTGALEVASDGKVHLSEQQAVAMALAQNFDINLERHTTLADLWRIRQLQAYYDPRFTLSWNWDREKTPTVSVLQGGPSLTNVVTTFSSGYSQQWSTGSSLEASFSGVRNRTTSFFSSLVPSISAQFDVQFRQSLLQGFGRVGQEYQIEISRKNLEISKQEFKRRVTEVVYRVQDRYWELVYSLKDIQVKEKSLQLARTVLEQNRARLAVGMAARLEVVQAEAEAALREEELVRSRYAFRLVQDQLIQLIADYEDPREFPGQILPSDPVRKPPQVEESFEALQARALQARPELEAAALEVATQEVNLKMTRNKLRPSLDLVAAYQQFGLGGNLVLRDFSQGFLDPPILGTQPGGLGGALDQMLTGGFYGYMLGLNLQLPIFNSEARTANAQALIARDRSAMRRRSIQQLVAVELRDALTQIEMNLARLQAADAAVISARERLVGEQARFEAGMATTRELIEAQRDLAAAESVQLRAQVDLVKSHALLDRAAGMTFDRHSIRLAEALAVNVRD